MLACNHERGSSPVVIDLWKITLRAGANSLAASCNIFAGTSLGPVYLFVFNSCSNWATPFVVMVMSGIAGKFFWKVGVFFYEN